MRMVYRRIHIPQLCKYKGHHKQDLVISTLLSESFGPAPFQYHADILNMIMKWNCYSDCFIYQPIKIINDNETIGDLTLIDGSYPLQQRLNMD